MKLIVCLGNPGEKHKKTRHNIGFRIADSLIKDLSLSKVGNKFKSKLYEGKAGREKLFLIKPDTFMNLSGEAVQPLLGFYKIPLENMLVIYDDVDIPFGKIRFRPKGSAGTHNGMRSIINILGSGDFPRLRFGVGPVPLKWHIADFVLSNFTTEEEKELPELIQLTIKEAEAKFTLGRNHLQGE